MHYISVGILLVLVPLADHHLFNHHVMKRSPPDCCIPAKLNVATKRSNLGAAFFKRLVEDPQSSKDVNADTMCNLIHFLMQQAKLNDKLVSFTKGMFVIYDSSKNVFKRFMEAKDAQISGDDEKYSGYFKRVKHMSRKALQGFFQKLTNKGQKTDGNNLTVSDTFIYVRGDESSHFHDERGSKDVRRYEYPAYGADVPGACMPSGFGHILFGEMKPLTENVSSPYYGNRIYIKPELFGIRQLKQFIKHAESYLDHISKRYICNIKDFQVKPQCTKEEAFRENTDKKLSDKWKSILEQLGTSLPNPLNEYIQNATKHGIHEIYRQTIELEKLNPKVIQDFRQNQIVKNYGTDDLSVRKGREIIYTTQKLLDSPRTCDMFEKNVNKCKT